MKKALIAIFFALSLNCSAQQDFDYKICTSHAKTVNNFDTVVRQDGFALRTFEKTKDLLTLNAPKDPTHVVVFKLRFIGVTGDGKTLVYSGKNEKNELITVEISPIVPKVEVNDGKDTITYY